MWAIVIYESEKPDVFIPVIYKCDNEESAKSYVLNTVEHFRKDTYLMSEQDKFKINGFKSGALTFRVLYENGGITEVSAININDEFLKNDRLFVCYRSESYPKIFEIGTEKSRENIVKLLKTSYIARNRKNHVEVNEEDTIVLIDDEDIKSNEEYLYICFSDGTEIKGNIAPVKSLEGRKYYNYTEEL